MNPIQRVIKEEIVDPRVMQGAITTYGYIITYNKYNNDATVSVFDKQIGKYVIYDKVPLMDVSNGVVSTSVADHDEVWIEFVGGNKNMPKVSGIKTKAEASGSITDTTASNNGQGIPDINGGFFSKVGDFIANLFGDLF